MTRTIESFCCVLLFAVVLLFAGNSFAQQWKQVGSSGAVVFVFVSPDGAADKNYMAQVLSEITKNKSGALTVMFFGDERYTPRGFPMTDKQMLHMKARYSRNPARDHEEFVWMRVVDAKASPPKLKETKANVRPGFAD